MFSAALPVQCRSRSARNAFACQTLSEPPHLLPVRLFLPTCSGKKLPHVWCQAQPQGSPHPLAPCSGTRKEWLAPCHSPSFHAQCICLQVSPKGLFVPSLAARLKSSYPKQRKRNILQVCNSLKHWTCSNMSLLLGRREDMFRPWPTTTHF